MQRHLAPAFRQSSLGIEALRFLLVLVLGIGMAGTLGAKTPVSKDKKSSKSFPDFDVVARTVEEQLAANRGYKSGDLLTTSTVEPLFVKLEKINWKVVDRKEIIKSVLPDSDWLARQLTSRGGKTFMR